MAIEILDSEILRCRRVPFKDIRSYLGSIEINDATRLPGLTLLDPEDRVRFADRGTGGIPETETELQDTAALGGEQRTVEVRPNEDQRCPGSALETVGGGQLGRMRSEATQTDQELAATGETGSGISSPSFSTLSGKEEVGVCCSVSRQAA